MEIPTPVTPDTVVKNDNEASEALQSQKDKILMDQLLEDAKKLAQKAAGSDDFKQAKADIAARVEEIKATPLGNSEQFYAVAKILMEDGGRAMDVTTEMGRNMLRQSTDEMYENVRNQMRAERASFEDRVTSIMNEVTGNEAFTKAENKGAIITGVLSGIAADMDSGTLSEEDQKVMTEVAARLKQLA